MASLLTIFNLLINFAWWIIIIQAILSWLVAFDVINLRQPFIYNLWNGLNRLTEPVYRPIRRMMPDLGGIDITPIVVLLLLTVLQVVVNNNLAPLAYG